jgi:hypothetical protein
MVVAVFAWSASLHAADTPSPQGSFFLQATPSPMVATVKPGQTSDLELKIRNAGTASESLKIETRSFSYNSDTGEVKLSDTEPAEIASWLSFGAPTFTVQAGEWYTQKIHVNVPANAGFSYSFAFLISRVNAAPAAGGSALQGSLAIFSLVNVDRPGAVRSMDVEQFTTDHPIYEYLPATLNVRLKNTGNTIVLPAGNIFVQRSASDTDPLSVLRANSNRGYVLPGTSRTFSADWDEGFQVYKTVQSSDGKSKRQLVWNWGNLSKLRIGRYTAKLVAVYNDGTRDVVIERVVSFWVIPWKLLLGALVVLLLVAAGLWSVVRSIFRRKPKR